MKALPLLTLSIPLLLSPVLFAQQPAPAPAADEKIELKDPAAGGDEGKVKIEGGVKKADLPDIPEAAPEESPKLAGLEKLTDEQRKILMAGMPAVPAA